MGKKQLWYIIIGLLIVNIGTISFFTFSQKSSTAGAADTETVATVGGEKITRDQWLHELDERYGKSVLRDLIDKKVIAQMAKKYGIKASEREINQEVTMFKTVLNPSDNKESSLNERQLQEDIQTNLLLEELVTKDVVVSDDEMEKYYKDNASLYNIPTTYHVSQIVVPSKKDALKTEEALKNGSHFDVLAMETSIDADSAPQGGDVGYISADSKEYSDSFLKTVESLKEKDWSKPVKVEGGYAIILLNEKINGTKFTYEDVKNQIRRQIALEHLKAPMSPGNFWKDAGVTWFYGKSGEND
ncbi:peptidyl-prolyl cis-trans isomerase [Falsibacillus albus]|uniref:peptidylprolyl isomerase n=1 Tax=Falsibacillus albus TaxID=2478915 RepID=A0A3L7JMH2_9BACI|nr:peptidyl-prolyl cis-trans isomerase [Falsibacillus albus]RLQ91670.1 peptidylprolyl isomerase [Falsibacillus albus]